MLDRRKPYVLRIRFDKQYRELEKVREQDPPVLAINAGIVREGRGWALEYLDLGSERGHIIKGKITKDMKNGVVFESPECDATFSFTELTYEEFDRRIRPHLSEWESHLLNDLDDVQVYYRKIAGMI